MWFKKIKPAHPFKIPSLNNKVETISINREIMRYVGITPQGVLYIHKHFPFAHINYERVEPGDRVSCAEKCTEFVNEAVVAIALPLPTADPHTMVYQYSHALQNSDPDNYRTSFTEGFAYEGDVETHPEYQRIVTTFAGRISADDSSLRLICYMVVLSDIDPTLTFMAMSYPIAVSVGPTLFVEFFGILKSRKNFNTFSNDVLNALRNQNVSFSNFTQIIYSIIAPRLVNAAFQFGTNAIMGAIVPFTILALTDTNVQQC